MTVRATIAIALAVALLGASLPTVETARIQHSEARVVAEVQRLERTATALGAENEVVDTGQPARSRFTLRLPSRSWGEAGIERFRLLPGCATGDVVWTVRGGSEQSYRFSTVRLSGPAGGLVISDGGRSRLVLELRRERGRRVVVARRPTRTWEP